MSVMDIDSLVERYRDAAVRYGRATTSQARNASAKKIAGVYRELRRRDERSRLLPLFADEDPSVRTWAAAHGLEFAPEQAVKVLEELASDPRGLVGLSAEMTLREWRAGRLRFV